MPLASPVTDSCTTPDKNSHSKKKVFHSNGQETFCWSSNYVTGTQSLVLYCLKEQFIQNWVRCNPEVKTWQVGRQRVVISNTVIGLWKGWCWDVATRFSCTKHVHLVHADKVFLKFHTSIKQITSCIKMLWCEEKCAQGFGGKTWKKPLGSLRWRWKDNIKMYLNRRRWGCGLD